MQRHKRSKSCTVPVMKKLEDDNIIDYSLNASQRLKLDLPRCCNKSVETKKNLSPDAATELIKEIAVLELEVVYLEQYLLSLYRKAFDQQTSNVRDNRLKTPCLVEKEPDSPKLRCRATQSRCFSFDNRLKDQCSYEEDIDSSVRRCQSSLNRVSPPEDSVFSCHSQPLSIKENIQTRSNIARLEEHMETRVYDHKLMTPNKLSEEMIKCVSAIYSKLGDPPLLNHGFLSPSSSPTSTSEFSPHDKSDMWSPSFRKNFDDQFEFSGPYCSMMEVSYIHRNQTKGRDLDRMNRNFSLLTKKLESVDPRKLTHQEKLAFWINIHNALVMQIFLANGIPQNNGKRFLLLSKPAYNIGGRMVSVDVIQSYILRIRMPRPGQWLKLLLIPRKFRTGDEHQDFSLDHSEPLLYFALCSGNHSDPAVRVYTPKGIYQELETAKEEYIRATFAVRKDQKLVLPKIIESFRKDSGMSHPALMEMIQACLPETMKKTITKLNSVRSRKSIVEWTPHSFVFRYLIARELVR